MSESLRELLVGIGFKDEATVNLNKIDKKVDNIRDSFGNMGKSAAGASANIADLGTRAAKTAKDIDRIDKRYKLWQQTASSMEKALNGNKIQAESLRSKINVLDREIIVSNKNLEKTKKLYGENSKEALKYKDHIQDLQFEHVKLNKELGGLGAARMAKGFTTAGNVMSSAGSWMTTRITLPVAATAAYSIKTFVGLEDAFSDVEKTVDGTPEQLNNIRKELDYMASNTIPIARKELYGMAADAGQLGIKTKNITKFTSTVAKLGKTTDLGSNASGDLAQFAGFTGMDIDDIDRLGSTIVELGNNTETTESKIVDMAMRIGAAGKQVRMSHSEIIGLAAGVSSLALEAEAGGTAVSKLLFDMQEATMTSNKNLGKYAKVAKMTSKEFKKAFEKNAANALVAFTGGLGELQNSGANVIGLLNDMGLGEVRLRDTILRAAGANGKLNETINMGNIAWEQNIALSEEFAKKAGNSASNIQLMKGKVEQVGNAFGNHLIPHINTALDLITDLTNTFGRLSPDTQANIFNGILGVAVGGFALGKLGKLATKIGILNAAVSSAGGWGAYLSGAGTKLAAFATGPVAVAAGKILLLAGAIYLLYKNWDKIANRADELTLGAYADKIKDSYKPNDKGYYPTSNHNRVPQKERTNIFGTPILPTSSYDRAAYYKMAGKNYTGTNYWKGGLTELAEHGPELVVGKQVRDLPKGSKVINNRETEDLFRNEGNAVVTQDVTFAPTLHIYLKNGNKEEIDKVKAIMKREFDPLMEDFFYRYRKKMAMAD